MELDDDLQTLITQQRSELTAAKAMESDLLFAYQLQVEEAMNVSLSHNGGGIDVPSSSDAVFETITCTSMDELIADDIVNYEQLLLDHQAAEDEMKRIRNDLNRRIHDQAFAREILNIPDEEWKKTGNKINKPYEEAEGGDGPQGEGVGSVSESFRVYVKGLMSEEEDEKAANLEELALVGGIGVAIFDANDGLVFEVSKGVVGGEMDGEVVELKALIEGLHFATVLGLKRVLIVSDSHLLHQCITGKLHPTPNSNIAKLVDHVTLLQRNLTHCNLSIVAQKDVKFVIKLAQDAIVSQARQTVLGDNKKIIETCAICLEDINTNRMFSIDVCLHRFCFSCTRRHVEVKLLQGALPKCPHENCNSELKTDDCKKFLMPELFEIMIQHIMEASIPPADKLYCPYPTCSALMSRSEFKPDKMTTLVRITCRKCHRAFCMDCRVPWHDDMTCSVYKQQNPHPCPEDAELKSLATRSLWRQCVNCKHMVSLGGGCNHIYCRCGHEFCYICGAPWKNKKATCTCPSWDEHNIIYGR